MTVRPVILFGLATGLLLIAAGAMTFMRGVEVHNDIRDGLLSQAIVTSDDASIPGAVVDGPDTAAAQAEIISEHLTGMLQERAGVSACTQLPRGHELDGTCTKAISRITALRLAQTAFGVASMAKGLGIFIVIVGVGVLVGPVVFQTRKV